MVQLLMPYAELKHNILLARERRDEKLHQLLASLTAGSVIQLSLNIPGPDKRPSGYQGLFRWGQQQLEAAMTLECVLCQEDALGPRALYTAHAAPQDIKQNCCQIENSLPAARLLDCDVYAIDGTAYDRALMALPQRQCLVCEEAARDCMRTKAHSWDQVKERLEELLQPYTTV